MSVIGVSKPKYAIYEYDETTKKITYSGGGSLGKATQVDVTINTSDGNNLYGDNGIVETDRQFTDGTITVGTDHLSQSVSKAILGAKEQTLPEIPGITDTDRKELIFDDDMSNPYLGQGYIIKQQQKNIVSWVGVVLTKTMFNVPDESATTQGEQIEWQTPSLVATILRDDSEKHMWKRQCEFTTEAQAEAYLDYMLGITAASEVTSVQPASAPARTAAKSGSESV